MAAYGAAGKLWVLQQIDGATVTARATAEFGAHGAISGKAACNSYSARQTVPYPWFKIERISATKMACADLPAETAFFTALREMSLSEVSQTTLLLSNDAGRTMTFTAE